MSAKIIPTTDVYTELRGFEALRSEARQDSPEALHKVAEQFEALFIQMVLKGMRETSMGDPLFGSDQTDFYRDMHDQQLSIHLSKGQGLGLADLLVRQLGGNQHAADNAGDRVSRGEALNNERLHRRVPVNTSATQRDHGGHCHLL